jgi:hypothetical protein
MTDGPLPNPPPYKPRVRERPFLPSVQFTGQGAALPPPRGLYGGDCGGAGFVLRLSSFVSAWTYVTRY